ncbi:MAG: bifunctional DNA-formamidopyrimidine glycosylase/DNA-(apurinic or apyrimidinic site) lyase [Planctomycetota bacterium]|nr:bifunctional DNA-formamidopyrimidine glycosylase/DNA-(apurinic or apyrimidinic site) lyase [Planctomycetota bacterium]
MPELPEVEVICRALRPRLKGKRLVGAAVCGSHLRHRLRKDDFRPLIGQKVTQIRRRGKYIVLEMSNGQGILLHLGMSGSLALSPAGSPRGQHVRVAWLFSDQQELRLRDPRRFGMAKRWQRERGDPPPLARLGPEPFSRHFTAHYLFRISRRRKCPLKNFLLDQKNVAGIGNIYAAESLFLARLSPFMAASDLTLPQCQRLTKAIKTVLAAAIRQGGTTIRDHRLLDGSAGNFAVRLRVYGRDGQPCPACGAALKRARQAGRSTYYCGHCQRKP